MNNEYLNLLQGAMLRELGKAIKTHKEDFDAVNCIVTDIFHNIELIYEEIPEFEFGSPTGRSMKFMPKRYKEMVMRLICPEFAFSYKKTESEFATGMEAFLFLNREDSKPVASGTATVLYSSIEDPNMDDFAKKRYAETIARGLAESKAMQKFGIGSWFHYEMEEENPEIMLDQAKKKVDFAPASALSSVPASTAKTVDVSNLPPVPTVEEDKKKERKSTKKEKEEVKEEVTTPVVPEVTTSPEVTKESATNDELAAARAVVCKHGKASGMTLGEIETKYPANIVWIYTQESCDYKDSIKTIILSNPAIKGYADQKGLKL